MKSNLIAATLLPAAAAAFVLAFVNLPVHQDALAIDWKVFWAATHGFQVDYAGQLAFSPPWALVLLWPLTALPLNVGWGLWAFLLLVVLGFAARRGSGPSSGALAIVLLCSSYHTIRQVVDGNIELLVIAGALLLLAALPRRQAWLFAAGVLLTSAKIQGSWLLILAAVFVVWRSWGTPAALRAYALAGLPVLLALLWRGAEWWQALQRFPFTGTAIDASLLATLARLRAPGWLIAAAWLLVLAATLWALRRRSFAQVQVGALAAAGLLLAPYAASNSVLTPLALVAPPLLARRLWLGVVVFAFANLPYFLLDNTAWRTHSESNYWTFFLLALWAISLWRLRSEPVSE